MSSPPGGRYGRKAVLWPLLLSTLLFGAVACGVPLSPAEMTATAVNGGNLVTATPEQHVLASSVLASIALDTPAGGPPAALATGTPAPGAPAPANATTAPATPTPSNPAPGTTTPRPATTGTPGTPAPPVTPSPTPTATGTPPVVLSSSGSSAPQSSLALGDPASQALKLVNDRRGARGLAPLRMSGALTVDAAGYAKYLGDQNYFAHDGLDGSSPSSRATKAGYSGRFKGEALAAGQSSADGALNTWLGSPAHAAIVLDASAVDVGIGYYSKPGSSYTYYWVLVTGVP